MGAEVPHDNDVGDCTRGPIRGRARPGPAVRADRRDGHPPRVRPAGDPCAQPARLLRPVVPAGQRGGRAFIPAASTRRCCGSWPSSARGSSTRCSRSSSASASRSRWTGPRPGGALRRDVPETPGHAARLRPGARGLPLGRRHPAPLRRHRTGPDPRPEAPGPLALGDRRLLRPPADRP